MQKGLTHPVLLQHTYCLSGSKCEGASILQHHFCMLGRLFFKVWCSLPCPWRSFGLHGKLKTSACFILPCLQRSCFMSCHDRTQKGTLVLLQQGLALPFGRTITYLCCLCAHEGSTSCRLALLIAFVLKLAAVGYANAGYTEDGTWDTSIPSGYADVSNIQAGVWDARHGRSLLANSNTTTVTFGVST